MKYVSHGIPLILLGIFICFLAVYFTPWRKAVPSGAEVSSHVHDHGSMRRLPEPAGQMAKTSSVRNAEAQPVDRLFAHLPEAPPWRLPEGILPADPEKVPAWLPREWNGVPVEVDTSMVLSSGLAQGRIRIPREAIDDGLLAALEADWSSLGLVATDQPGVFVSGDPERMCQISRGGDGLVIIYSDQGHGCGGACPMCGPTH